MATFHFITDGIDGALRRAKCRNNPRSSRSNKFVGVCCPKVGVRIADALVRHAEKSLDVCRPIRGHDAFG
jgi:hypothetical protein